MNARFKNHCQSRREEAQISAGSGLDHRLATPPSTLRCLSERRLPSANPVLSAFSLIEILVTVGILSFIIIGLLMMFNQTQRAFREGMTQSDVLGAGRATAEMVRSDIEQVTPCLLPSTTNFLVETAYPARLNASFNPVYFVQDLPGDNPVPQERTNYFQQLFFLTHENVQWTGIGYLVDTPTNGFGTLYRFQYQTNNSLMPMVVTNLLNAFQNAAVALYTQAPTLPYYLTNSILTRVADGVVDLRVKAFGPSGTPLTTTNFVMNSVISTARLPVQLSGQATDCFFYSNAVPAYVELQIGFLEDRTLGRLRSIPNIGTAQSDYLKSHSANVHLFRQRIAIRNVDMAAYPYP